MIAKLHGVLMKLTKLQESKVNDILDALPHSAYLCQEDRRARGLMKLVSEAANYLFGIGRQKNINRLDRVQKELKAQSDITSKDLAALANATDITIEDINHSLTNLHNNLTDLQARLTLLTPLISLVRDEQQIDRTYQSILNTVLANHMTSITYLQMMLHETNNFATGIQNLLQGHLSKAIVPASAIKRSLKGLSEQLRRDHPRFKVVFLDPGYYYDNAVPHFLIKGDDLLIYMKVPVTADVAMFWVYQIKSFLTPVHFTNSSSADATIIQGLPSEMALSLDKTYYIPLSTSDLARCQGDTVKTCPDIIYAHPVTAKYCLAALIRNEDTDIFNLCDTRYVLRPEFDDFVININNHQILVAAKDQKAQVLCESGPTETIPIHNYAIVSL